MPVYNVEAYLEETVKSILAQTLDFEKNIQIVFINDGSPDNSEAICLKYKEKFPDNIVYKKQKNQGVSAARNAGVKLAEGKYISFLDSDDLLSPDALEEVYNFFEKNYDKIDVVSIKLMFFEAKEGPHMLNYKYDSTRIIDIDKEYDCVQLSGGSAFVKTEAMKDKFFFNTKLRTAEDATLLTELILEKMAYGVVRNSVCYYRRRLDASSAISSSTKNKSWYTDTLDYAYLHVLSYAREKLGYVPEYVQYLVMYDLQWRFKLRDQAALDKNEEVSYKQALYRILSQIDDHIIYQQKYIQSEDKIFLLGKKHQKDIISNLKVDGYKYYFNDLQIYNYNWGLKTLLEIFEVKQDSVLIEGRLWSLLLPGVEFGYMVDDTFFPVEKVKRPQLDKIFLGEYISEGSGYKVTLPIKPGSVIKAVFKFKDKSTRILHYVSGGHSRLLDFEGRPYRATGSYLVCQPDTKTIVIAKRTPIARLKKEIVYLLSTRNIRDKSKIVMSVYEDQSQSHDESDSRYRSLFHQFIHSVFIFRCAYFVSKLWFQKPVWIISDRVNAAGDNGEAFFKYLQNNKSEQSSNYFAIQKTSPDYEKIKKIGRVIDRDSWFYKLLFLHADKIISSHADDFVINAFGKKQRFLRDLFGFDYVFLQHGITKDDMSGWLNKYNKNIKVFVTAANDEYESIVNGNYYYKSHNIALTGFPRYDLLKSTPENKIILAPTWRKGLSTEVNESNERPYSKYFKQSDYFKFYNGILNDEKIKSALRRYNSTIEFYLHPSHLPQLKDFSGSERVKIMDFPYEYKKAFREGSLLITDYSSVAFDFAYMKKPVIYAQFDKKDFFGSHIYQEGYFSYEENGFGPVVDVYDDLVDQIINTMKNSYKMDNRYKTRVDGFFAHTDKLNSKRVFEAILEVDRIEKGVK